MVIESAAKCLQASQVIGQSELFAQLRENRPIAPAFDRTERLFQARAEIRAEAVVVQQRVVHIQQKNNLLVVQHGKDFSGWGSCQLSPLPSRLAAAGPHVPGSYSSTGGAAVKPGPTPPPPPPP